MIERNYEFVKGIGPKTQEKLNKMGYHTWKDIINRPKPDEIKLSIWNKLTESIQITQDVLKSNNLKKIKKTISSKYHEELLPQFFNQIVYLDIETTGLSFKKHSITTIAAFDMKKVYTFIADENLDEFPQFIKKYPAICTFYGKNFDIPFIKRKMHIKFPQIHFDVRFLMRKVGIKGGLKKIEHQFNLSRGDIEGIDGFTAIKLWKLYKKSQNRDYLDTLLAYNVEDVLNLPFLLVTAYNKISDAKYSIFNPLQNPKISIENPYQPSKSVLKELFP